MPCADGAPPYCCRLGTEAARVCLQVGRAGVGGSGQSRRLATKLESRACGSSRHPTQLTARRGNPALLPPFVPAQLTQEYTRTAGSAAPTRHSSHPPVHARMHPRPQHPPGHLQVRVQHLTGAQQELQAIVPRAGSAVCCFIARVGRPPGGASELRRGAPRRRGRHAAALALRVALAAGVTVLGARLRTG